MGTDAKILDGNIFEETCDFMNSYFPCEALDKL